MRPAGADLGVPVGDAAGGGPHGLETVVRAIHVPLFSHELWVDGRQRGGCSRFSLPTGGTTILSARRAAAAHGGVPD